MDKSVHATLKAESSSEKEGPAHREQYPASVAIGQPAPQLTPEPWVQANNHPQSRAGLALARQTGRQLVLGTGRGLEERSPRRLGKLGFTSGEPTWDSERGKMRPLTYPHPSCPTRLSRLSFDSLDDFSPALTQVLRRLVALAMVLLLLPLGQQELLAQQAPPPAPRESRNDPYNGQYAPDQQLGDGQQPPSGQVYPQQDDGQAQPLAEPLNAVQLEQLVAPIALYPDALVAQVLAASTCPQQVVDAAHWRLAQGYASPDQIAAGADAQNWDPSVKALTAFPQVLAQMDRNLQWTIDLGNAYYNQPQDVLQAVQVMRRRALSAGNLQSTPQEAVSYDHGHIELAPVNPQVVYVPAYNPWSVYGEPVSPYPGFSLLGALGSFFGSSAFGSSGVRYGLGIAMAAFSHTPWGWLAWGLNWLSQSVLFHQANYYSQSTAVADWGFPNGGGRQGGGYNSTVGRGFVPRPPQSYSRPVDGRATLGRAFVPRPPTQYAMNRSVESSGRRTYNGVRTGYDSRPGAAYFSPHGSDRAPKSAFQRANFKPQSSVGRGFGKSTGKSPHSGGLHPFGGGHTPKSFGGGKHFSSRHSGGGGHSSSHSSGRHHH